MEISTEKKIIHTVKLDCFELYLLKEGLFSLNARGLQPEATIIVEKMIRKFEDALGK